MTQARTLALVTTVSAAAIILFLDIPGSLGAHPWWAAQVVWIGAPFGLALALLITRQAPLPDLPLVLLALLTASAYAISADGKSRFAASYAEDVLAGRFWYYGWIAAAFLGATTVFATAHALVARLRSDER